jgi:hypothetical protein
MYFYSLSRTLLTCLSILFLTACGGGGGGGGGGLAGGGATDDGDATASTGSITLTVGDLGEDGVLAGNEFATISAEVVENGNAANVVVLFETSIGSLVSDSAQSTGGIAEIQITGDGTAGGATVTARATLSDGTELVETLVVQMSSDAPTIQILNASGAQVTTVELRAAEAATLTARVQDWDGTRLSGVGVNFALAFATRVSLTASIASGATDSNGELVVTVRGTQDAGTGTFTASAAFNQFALQETIAANGLGVNEDLNNLTIDTIDVGSDGVLAGNEKTMVVVRVLENGVAKNGITVGFSSTSGNLTAASASSANNGTDDGVAMVQLIGNAAAGAATVRASATLTNGITLIAEQIVQTSAGTPTLSLEIRDAAGNVVTSFGANQELTLEATIVDHDGSVLDADDAGVLVAFTDASVLGTLLNSTDVTELSVCPVNGIKANADCAFVSFTSNTNANLGQLAASAEINQITLSANVQVENTGINSGAGDQDSFTITRRDSNDAIFAIDDIFALEGDQFNGQTAKIEVDLADFFNNPVPDGTTVEFVTELGDVGGSCTTVSGNCFVTFTSSDPRTPIDSEVSFRNLTDDNCPSTLIVNERTSISGSTANTDYRVKSVKRVARTTGGTFPASSYTAVANGIECLGAPCSSGTAIDITYERLWLDEVDDGLDVHVISNPGEATEPFLAVTGTPCLASTRDQIERITGTINADGTTGVTGVGTLFKLELAVGDRLKVQDEVREITAIASSTSLTTSAAFSDGDNDVSPQRIVAPAYQGGLGQPYGAKSTILAYALGEESFVDVNGNEEYDFGETFFDLPEVFMDKNTDGILGDVDGQSASATTIGPYKDAGTGTAPTGGKRDLSSPFCYGPKTIVGDPAGAGSSTELNTYCYQDGGEEEFFIDLDGDNLMGLGNGIYNGSRCLTPLQDSDNDGAADDTVCTTDLINISREVEILLAGSSPFVQFRTSAGERVSRVAQGAGGTIADTSGSPESWNNLATTQVPTITLQNGATVNTSTGLAGGAAAPRDIQLFSISNAITTTAATWTLTFDVDRTGDANTGPVEVFAGVQLIAFDDGDSFCGETPSVVNKCRAVFTANSTGTLIFAASEVTLILAGKINNVSLTGVETGLAFDYQIRNSEEVTSNDNTAPNLTNFNVGDTIDATTVFAGVSDRLGDKGALPDLATRLTTLVVHHTDQYNGRLPEGTKVTIASDKAAGCALVSVGGSATVANSVEVIVGQSTGNSTSVVLKKGVGSGSVTATVSTPVGGGTSSRSISCAL